MGKQCCMRTTILKVRKDDQMADGAIHYYTRTDAICLRYINTNMELKHGIYMNM